MQTYAKTEEKLQTILTSALDRDEWQLQALTDLSCVHWIDG
jgi:hypothetical protein